MTPTGAGRTIAIGDIHGCIHALEAVLGAISPQQDDRIIMLGDFVDQGHESRAVLECLIALKSACHLVCLLGNHEEMMLAARDSERALRYWEMCGGVQTLNSYRFGGTLRDVPPGHWAFLENCRDSYETERHLFVHANFDPELPLDQQLEHTLRWALLEPELARCHTSGKTVILGHTEQVSSEVLDLGCIKCIDTACWRYGWLTALEVDTGQLWQASRFGALREQQERPVGSTAELVSQE